MYQKDSHCSYCGWPFTSDRAWPRTCRHCGNVTFQNPTPVAVLLLPVETPNGRGLLVVRRNIQPQKGKLALPGGYIDVHESWQAAAVRELREETGIALAPEVVAVFQVTSVPRNVLIFGIAPPVAQAALPPFEPNSEASQRLVLTQPAELAFSAHTAAAARFFQLAA